MVLLCVFLPAYILSPMYIQQLGEVVLPPRHNTVEVWNQISFFVLYYNSSRLVPLLEVINAPIQVPNIVDLTVSFQFLDFRFGRDMPYIYKLEALLFHQSNFI